MMGPVDLLKINGNLKNPEIRKLLSQMGFNHQIWEYMWNIVEYVKYDTIDK